MDGPLQSLFLFVDQRYTKETRSPKVSKRDLISEISHIWKVYKNIYFSSNFDTFAEWIVWRALGRFPLSFTNFRGKLDWKSKKSANFQNLLIFIQFLCSFICEMFILMSHWWAMKIPVWSVPTDLFRFYCSGLRGDYKRTTSILLFIEILL